MPVIRSYESPELREVTGPTLRPGGFTLTDHAVEICNLPSGAAVLDVGCGLGATVHRLTSHYGFKAFGLDAAAGLLREGHRMGPANCLMAGLAERLPLRRERVDAVICECVLSLLNAPQQALSEFCQAMKPGGRLAVLDVYARRTEGALDLNRLPLNSCLKGVRPLRELVEWIEGAGFEMVLWEDHSHLLKRLAAELVFQFGSMQRFWAEFAPDCAISDIRCGLDQARPGYCLIVALKKPKAQR